MEKIRCAWCLSDPIYIDYHDNEWGKPVRDDATMFEFLLLETYQAGLSWITILKKRENCRQAFDAFDYEKIARYSDDKLEELMQNMGIIRNRLKINAARSNAQAFIEVRQEFGSFCTYLWGFIGPNPIDNKPEALNEIPASTPLSDQISKDLKKRGFKFTGSTVIYAHLQATGLINDHIADCWTRGKKTNSSV